MLCMEVKLEEKLCFGKLSPHPMFRISFLVDESPSLPFLRTVSARCSERILIVIDFSATLSLP